MWSVFNSLPLLSPFSLLYPLVPFNGKRYPDTERGREASVLLMLCSFFHLTERKESNYDVQRLAAIGELIDSVGQTEQKDETGVSEREKKTNAIE